GADRSALVRRQVHVPAGSVACVPAEYLVKGRPGEASSWASEDDVTTRGSIITTWANTGAAGSSSSRGKAITRPACARVQRRAAGCEMGSGSSKPNEGCRDAA